MKIEEYNEFESSILLEMAMERSKLIDKLQYYQDILEEHLLKCCVYKNTTNDFYNWIGEISGYIALFSGMTTKPRNNKLTKDQYKKYLFGNVFDTSEDTTLCLATFKIKNKKVTNPYPDFIITDELKQTTHSICNNIMNDVCEKLAEKQTYTQKDFANIIVKIMKDGGDK